MATQHQVGDCVLVKQQVEGFEHHLGIELEDFQLSPPQFLSKHNSTLTKLLEKFDIQFTPLYLARPTTKSKGKARWIVINMAGHTETIFEEDILITGTHKITLPLFERWNLLSLVEEGLETQCPLPPRTDGLAHAYHYNGTWYALKEKETENRFVTQGKRNPAPELEMMQPQLTFDEINEEHKTLVLGLPGVDNWKPKYYKNRIGIGYCVEVPSKDITYSSSPWINRKASAGIQTKSATKPQASEEIQHFYIPLERLRPIFKPDEKNISKGWYAINWCITSFKRFFPNA